MPLYTAITEGDTISAETKAKIAEEITRMFQSLPAVATDQFVLSLQEIPSSNAMEWAR